jgi:dephospho-CoA kinase
MTYAITGGIGSGKSFYCRKLQEAGYPIFYCDDEAKRIIRTSDVVRRQLCELVGYDLYDAEGRLQKPVLAAYLCRGKEYAEQDDAIVHPRVAEAFQEWAVAQQKVHKNVFMECALLYESGFEHLVDRVILVTASQETRIRRVMARDKVTREKALAWMALQMPEEEKLKRAHHVVNSETDGELEGMLFVES